MITFSTIHYKFNKKSDFNLGTLKERGLERLSDEPNSLKIENTRCKVYDLPGEN